MVDYISELPDDVLSYILTRISMKDLLKTSVLSKRWCELWTLRKDLHFDIFNVFGETEEELVQTGYVIDVPDGPTMKTLANLNTTRDEFVKRVDQFVNNFHGTKIASFFVNFYLNSDQSTIIDRWITFAIAREVEIIDLLFLGLPYARSDRRKFYKFPFDLLLETNTSTLKHLSLKGCLICNPTNYDFRPLKNLRFLSLNTVKLDEIFIEKLLFNCGFLEELHLISCHFQASMPKIISSSLLNLKIINVYIVPNMGIVDIDLTLLDCPKLNSLDYLGDGLGTMSINTPMLKYINFPINFPIRDEEQLNTFSLCATFLQLETMRVDITSTVIASLNINQPFKHLKELNLILLLNFDIPMNVNYDLLWILNLLQASPLLQKLSAMFTYPEFLEKQKDIRDIEIFHDEIKVIEFRGFLGNWFEIEFVINVLKYVEKLEQIVLTPCWKEDDSMEEWISDPVCFQSARERISEKLQGEQVLRPEKLVLL
ncbi:unnamed protein product [Lathyrus sativus]|nr:unnamed protein product [Lathyrus sativus]